MEPSLDTNIQFLTGVGPKRAALYQKLDIFTIRDLLYYFPRSYIDLSSPCEIAALPAWETCGVKARVVVKSAPQYVRRGMTISRVRVADDTGSMVITFLMPNTPSMPSIMTRSICSTAGPAHPEGQR